MNVHSWQNWILTKDTGEVIVLEMPDHYTKEMVADWIGAGQAIHGKGRLGQVSEWYEKNKTKIRLHPVTRLQVETMLASLTEVTQ